MANASAPTPGVNPQFLRSALAKFGVSAAGAFQLMQGLPVASQADRNALRAMFVGLRNNLRRELGWFDVKEAPTPVEATAWDNGEVREVEAEVMPALPAPMAVEQQCVCSHGRNAHPADGPCELCAYKGIRACGLYSSMEARARRSRAAQQAR